MAAVENAHLWSTVVETAGLRIPEEQRAAFNGLAVDIQDLMGVLRESDLGDTPPGFAFRVQ